MAQRHAGVFRVWSGFVDQRRAEAVTEQRQGRIGEITQGKGGVVGEIFQTSSRCLVEAVLVAQILQGKQIDV